jgi:hypothetical protein
VAFGDDRGRAVGALLEHRFPHAVAIGDRHAVENLVGHDPAVGDLPRPHVHGGDGSRVARRRLVALT